MAEKKTAARAESRRRGVPRELKGPIGQLAERVRSLSEHVRLTSNAAEQLGAVQTRCDQLRSLTERVNTLAMTAQCIDVHPMLPMASIEDARDAVRELRVRYRSDPASVRSPQPKALEAPIAPSSAALREAWSKAASAPPGAVALAELLGRLPDAFGTARTDIQRLCAKLSEAARALPTSADDVVAVRDLQRQIRDRIEALKNDGLDDAVRTFLSEATTDGASLESLLEQPVVVDFLGAHDLLGALTVHFRRPGER